MGRQIKYGHLLHGGDYNPEQWLDRPDILKKDIEYFKEAKINTVSVGMFSWAMLEPEEGNFHFTQREFLQFCPHRPVQDRNGFLISTRKYCV